MPFEFESHVSDITDSEMKSAHEQLKKHPDYESFSKYADTHGNIKVEIVSGTQVPDTDPDNPDPTSYAYTADVSNDPNFPGVDILVRFTEEYLKKYDYTSDSGPQTLTVERVLSHEVMHVIQNLTGDTSPPSIREGEATQFDNTIMKDLYGEPPRTGYNDFTPRSTPHPDIPTHLPTQLNNLTLPDWVPDAMVPFQVAGQQDSPLVLDMDSDGIELVALNTTNPGTFFDLDNDGFAEASGWVSPDDGLLARDLNDNGRIDNASELFGNTSTDGFAILSLLDSNGDLVINQNDTAFAELLIWKDANGNGLSEAGELHDIDFYGIANISLSGVTPSTAVIAGNQISHTSTFTYFNGSQGAIVDAWFAVDNTLSKYSGEPAVDIDAFMLPSLRGFGALADLHTAMSLDNGAGGLLELLDAFANSFSLAAFADESALRQEIETILFKWANVTEEGQVFTDGPYDGQAAYAEEVQFLEKLFGVMSESTAYNPDGTGGRVPGGAGRALAESFEIAYQNIAAQLLIQVGTESLFNNPPSYNAFTGEIDGSLALSQTGINSLVAYATASGVNAENYWVAVAKFLDTVKGFANFTATENTWLDTAINTSDPGLTWTEVKDLATFEYQPSTIFGTPGDDVINGTAGDNIIAGYTGNDVIDGKEGNDTITANTNGPVTSEDDGTYIGGAGHDFVNAGQGNDIYIYTSGDDFYEDIQGTDVIKLPQGIALGDLHFAVSDTYNLIITVGDLGSIEIKQQFQNNPYFIETLEFYDTSTLSLITLNNITQYGTGGNDVISGIAFGAGDEDIIFGMDGNDTIYGGTGDDTIDGGAGNDTITPGSGTDTIIASEGFDTILASSAVETLVIPAAFSASDVILLREADGSGAEKELKIIINGLGQIHVDDHFYGTSKALDQITFANGIDSAINLLTYTFTTIGTNGNDYFDTSGYGLSNSSDIYFFGQGQDTVMEYAGTDTVLFAAGLNLSNIAVIKQDTGNSASTTKFLVISDADGNSMTFERHFDSSGYRLENLKLNNGTVISIASLEIDSHGSSGNDRLDGIAAGLDLTTNDVMYGHGGNDNIYAGVGNDVSYGGDGDDYIFDDAGNDTLYGEDGIDQLYGYTGDDVLYGGAGNDTLRGDDTFASSSVTGNDTVSGGDGNDNLSGGRGNDTLDGGAGNDVISGDNDTDTVTFASATAAVTVSLALTTAQNTIGAGTDTITNVENLTGSAYNDALTGNTGANVLTGGDGNDVLDAGTGNDTLDGGNGLDTASYASAASAVTVNLATTTAQNTVGAGTDTLVSVENVRGSAFNDTLTGSSGVNVIEGGAGDDTLNGAAGTDTLSYVSAASAVTVNLATTTAQNTVGSGSDTVSNFENLTGSAFNDTLTGNTGNNVIEGGAGNDAINGSTGTDTASYESATAAVTVSLAVTTAQNTFGAGTDTLTAMEHLRGSAYNDTLTGTSGDNTIEGGAGDDTMNAGSGSDTLLYASASSGITVSLALTTAQNTGGAGTDTVSNFEKITGSAYADILTGSSAANTLDGGLGDDILDGGAGNDTLNGNTGTDTSSYASATAAVTVNLSLTTAQNTVGAGTDTLQAVENLTGSGFNDTLTGSTSANVIIGGAGNDTLRGGAANDTLKGGLGTDTLYGEGDADTFVFESASAFTAQDTVADFSTAQGDKLNIADLLIGYTAGQSAIDDFVTFTTAGANTNFAVDRDGTGATYSLVTIASLTGVTGLDADTLLTNGNLIAA